MSKIIERFAVKSATILKVNYSYELCLKLKYNMTARK